MIDFKKRMKAGGTKAILRQSLPRLPALVSEYGSDVCNIEQWVEFEIVADDVPGDNRHVQTYYIKIHGGPTGYESVDLIKILKNEEVGAKWVACMGSHNYRRMEIRIDNIRHAVKNYGVNYQFEIL
jgi:hypothetical protein